LWGGPVKISLLLGTTVEVAGRYYKIGLTVEDDVRSDDVSDFDEFKAVVIAKTDDLEDAIQPILIEKLTNLVEAVGAMKFDAKGVRRE
jgi:hypothetical protein